MTARRDRTGELVDEQDDQERGLKCDGGWIDRDEGRPCFECRPHLRRTLRLGVQHRGGHGSDD